jgi:hypothetical protein
VLVLFLEPAGLPRFLTTTRQDEKGSHQIEFKGSVFIARKYPLLLLLSHPSQKHFYFIDLFFVSKPL